MIPLIRYYSYSCPSCGEVTDRSWSKVLMGPARSVCRHCSREYAAAALEWPQMRGKERRELLLPDMVQIWLAVTVIVMLFVSPALIGGGDRAIVVAGQLLLFLLAPVLLFLVARYVQIRRSIARSRGP